MTIRGIITLLVLVVLFALAVIWISNGQLASPSLAYLMLFSTKVCTERIGTCQSSTSGSTVISLVTGRPVTCF